MKTKDEIYKSIEDSLYEKIGIDVAKGSAIDSFILASSEQIGEAYEEIENNKTPYLFTSLEGERIDNMATLCGLTREVNESDRNFLYRLLKWNVSNKSSNMTSIETSLINLTYSSHVTYIPHAFGCGTAAAYIIPVKLDETTIELAKDEVKNKLSKVTSPSTYIEYIVPEIIPIRLVMIIKADGSDITLIKNNIADKVVEYVNGIAPGENLEIGMINKLGIGEQNVDYFSVGHVFIDGKETGSVTMLQKTETKFLINKADIEWMEVE